MKISLNWIKEYVSLPPDLTTDQIRTALTISTVEVEDAEDISEKFENMIVGPIVKIAKHPDADRLSLVDVELGPHGIRTLVCGGSNLKSGIKVAVALPGARVLPPGQKEYVTIKAAKVRGVESHGMIAASSEIGLVDIFPMTDSHEILDLTPHTDSPAGTTLATALRLDDTILTIDNKSLTNRPDLWGHYGIARELSAIFDAPLKPLPTVELPPANDAKLKVEIEDTSACMRYIGVLFDGMEKRPTPFEIRKMLFFVGQRPINLLVDLTNYVMFLVGQPMHVFDYDSIQGKGIVVRRSRPGESLQLLDGKSYELTEADLAICDDVQPLAIAGIMGGEPSGVTENSSGILLESATFEPIGIRRTASRHKLRSESSIRFEKGIDAARARQAIDLFLTLLRQVEPSVKLRASADCYPVKDRPVTVTVSRGFIVSRIGKELSTSRICERLMSLGFKTEESNDTISVVVPSWRSTGDVSIPEDLVEEVARLIGYDNLGFVPPKVELTKAVLQPEFDLVRAVREYLALSTGMNEIVTYPWVEENLLKAAGIDPAECLSLFAPSSENARFLRPSLVPAMLSALERNIRFFSRFSIFEVARVFLSSSKYPESGKGEQLPGQPNQLAGAVAGPDEREIYFRAKGILEGLFKSLRFPRIEFRSGKDPAAWAALGTDLSIHCGPDCLGRLALLSPAAALQIGLEKSHAAVFELDLPVLQRVPRLPVVYRKLPQFPVVEFDLAMIFNESVSWADISKVLATTDPLISEFRFLDEYHGSQIPNNKKSIAFQLVLLDPNATLTSERASAVANKAVVRLSEEIGAELRGSI